ncbi:MAG: outer membrane beta-barrel protein [Chitinispirillaceae bacterium]
MRKNPLTFCLAAVITLTCAAGLSAQELKLSLDAGISRPTRTEIDNYNWGYSLGGNVLFTITDNLFLGGRIAYNRWGPDESAFLDRADPTGIIDSADVSGEATIVEVVPIARLSTNYPLSPVNFFVQGGAGLYVMNLETTVTGVDQEEEPFEQIFGEDEQYRFGAQLGAGLMLGSPDYLSVELYPAYHLIFNKNGDGETFQYFTVNLGIGLGI